MPMNCWWLDISHLVRVSNTRRGWTMPSSHCPPFDTFEMFWDEWTKPVKLHGTARTNSCQIQHKSQLTMNSDDTTPPISRWDIAQRIVDVLALRPCTLDRIGRFQLGDVEFWSKFFSQFSHCYIIDSSSLKGGLEDTRPDRPDWQKLLFFLFFGCKKQFGQWRKSEITGLKHHVILT